MINRAAFLDRDGVINRKAPEGEYVTQWDDFHFLPGVAEAIGLLNGASFRVIVVTNQRCVARGILTLDELNLLHRRMLASLADAGATIDEICVCPHDHFPPCSCRKPESGMLIDAARRNHIDLNSSWMIGDSDSDVEAGNNAGCNTVRLLNTNGTATHGANMTASCLLEAVRQILLCDESIPHLNAGAELETRKILPLPRSRILK